MRVVAVLVIGARVLPVVGDAQYAGEFQPRLLVEVRVPTTRVNGAMPNPKVGQTAFLVRTSRNVASKVGHPVIVAFGPRKGRDRKQVGTRGERVGAAYAERRLRQADVH